MNCIFDRSINVSTVLSHIRQGISRERNSMAVFRRGMYPVAGDRYGFICGMMQKSIFISYRREDSAGHAGRIYDRLEREFGDSCRLFMDVDAIPLGVDFAKHLTEEVATCDVLLAVIGRQWVEGDYSSQGM
jgi:hypothetical protein